eukprot:TRINITY_DN16218_c0_g1_i1.p1 TRINITY_DN16218_c0_g1~~TRINITY_DN16218_c0_g1_i1.p1  ORF type:complete len:377 (-),score=59.86 TRINITY_DN16218_c0_g1_i1:331-1461(-)
MAPQRGSAERDRELGLVLTENVIDPGMTVGRVLGHLRVVRVADGSWAEFMGVHVGDMLASVDGDGTRSMPMDHLRKKLQSRPVRLIIEQLEMTSEEEDNMATNDVTLQACVVADLAPASPTARSPKSPKIIAPPRKELATTRFFPNTLLERIERRFLRPIRSTDKQAATQDAGKGTHDPQQQPHKVDLPEFKANLPELSATWRRSLILPNAQTELMLCLIDNLPPLFQVQQTWHLGYSTSTHGISLNTLYRSVADVGPCFLVVQDIEGNVFGAYASDGLRPHRDSYGTMETYLFRCYAGKEAPDIFRPSTISNFCDKKGIIVGLDGPALAVEEDLLRGTSKPSATFRSPCLTESSFGAEFVVKKLEVWYWDTGFWD